MRRLAGLLLLAGTALANDAAVETAAGGVRLKNERSVKMMSERLYISPALVRVDYVFRNTTSAPVTSEVGFPVPPLHFRFDDPGAPRNFADFRAWVNGVPAPVVKEVRAFAGKNEVTAELERLRVGIESFGRFDPEAKEPLEADDIQRLPAWAKERLVTAGALKRPGKNDKPALYEPVWETRIVFHFTQTFPPGKDVKVHHEYKPVVGFSWIHAEDVAREHPGACPDEAFLREAARRGEALKDANNRYLMGRWVKYILTTANTWQTPIGEFELTVEKPRDGIVSFCWDGTVEKAGPDRFLARKRSFVPAKELEVLFLTPPRT